MEVKVDNWRWAGVPFFLRTGKRLPQRVTEIAIRVQAPAAQPVHHGRMRGRHLRPGRRAAQHALIPHPAERSRSRSRSRRSGPACSTRSIRSKWTSPTSRPSTACCRRPIERLLLDVLRGDTTLFTRSDELEAAWRFVTPVLDTGKPPKRSRNPTPRGRGARKAPTGCSAAPASTGGHRRSSGNDASSFFALIRGSAGASPPLSPACQRSTAGNTTPRSHAVMITTSPASISQTLCSQAPTQDTLTPRKRTASTGRVMDREMYRPSSTLCRAAGRPRRPCAGDDHGRDEPDEQTQASSCRHNSQAATKAVDQSVTSFSG